MVGRTLCPLFRTWEKRPQCRFCACVVCMCLQVYWFVVSLASRTLCEGCGLRDYMYIVCCLLVLGDEWTLTSHFKQRQCKKTPAGKRKSPIEVRVRAVWARWVLGHYASMNFRGRAMLVATRGPPRRASTYEISKSTGFHMNFWISKWISEFQSEFLDFKRISGFHLNRYYSEDTAKI